MSCTFWNMRRRLKAQKKTDKIIANLAETQKAEKAEVPKAENKSAKKGGVKNDGRTS